MGGAGPPACGARTEALCSSHPWDTPPSLRGLRENPLPADFSLMLLACLYEAFPLTCPRCGAEVRIITFITEAVDVRAILEHIGEPLPPPRIAQARGPPEWYEDVTEHAIDAEVCSAGEPYAQPAPEHEYDQRVSW